MQSSRALSNSWICSTVELDPDPSGPLGVRLHGGAHAGDYARAVHIVTYEDAIRRCISRHRYDRRIRIEDGSELKEYVRGTCVRHTWRDLVVISLIG